MIAPAKKMAHFQPGELVRHKRYGYRAVVVALDDSCLADETWYQSNQTQPDRSQPWYHCLVHGSHATTYVAEKNLIIEPDPKPIQHALIERFFNGFDDDSYERNDVAWQE